jgi:hypothetical protein
VRRPWPEGGFAKARNQSERGGRDCEEDDEKWRQREKLLGLTARSLLIVAAARGTQRFTGLHLKLWIGGHDYPNGIRNLFQSIYDRGK